MNPYYCYYGVLMFMYYITNEVSMILKGVISSIIIIWLSNYER